MFMLDAKEAFDHMWRRGPIHNLIELDIPSSLDLLH